MDRSTYRPVLVWDGFVRLFHLLLILGFGAAFVIARFLGEDHPAFRWHMIAGLTVGVLVVARIAWGFVGTRWARWSTMFHSPRVALESIRHLARPGGPHFTGHTPLSSLGIFAMLGLALALAITGLLLARGNESVEKIHPVLANLFLLLVVVHIAGVVLHQVVHDGRLILGMIDGRKVAPEDHAVRSAAPWATLLLLAATAWIGGGMAFSYDPATGTTRIPGLPFTISLGDHGGETPKAERHAWPGAEHEDEEHHEREEHH